MISRRRQHFAFQRGMTLFERRLLASAGAARNAYLRKAAKAVNTSGQVPEHLNNLHRARLKGVLADHYAAVGEYFSALSLSSLSKGKKAALTPVQALMLDWINREAVRKARMIADTDRDDIAGVLAKGVAEGESTAAIATNIRRLAKLTPRKASVIARTETHAAATYGSIESVREAEQTLEVRMLKAWLPTSDARTRPEHLAMRNHPVIPLDQKFDVGGELMDRPGDPAGSASNTISCRCSLVYSEAE